MNAAAKCLCRSSVHADGVLARNNLERPDSSRRRGLTRERQAKYYSDGAEKTRHLQKKEETAKAKAPSQAKPRLVERDASLPELELLRPEDEPVFEFELVLVLVFELVFEFDPFEELDEELPVKELTETGMPASLHAWMYSVRGEISEINLSNTTVKSANLAGAVPTWVSCRPEQCRSRTGGKHGSRVRCPDCTSS